MKGKRHQWKCGLVLLLTIALIGSSVDYTMLSASAQGTDSVDDQEETGADGTEAGKMSFLSGVSLEQGETNPEELGAGAPADVDLEAADGNETVKTEPGNPDKPGEEASAGADRKDSDAGAPDEAGSEDAAGEGGAGDMESAEMICRAMTSSLRGMLNSSFMEMQAFPCMGIWVARL